MSCSRLVNSCFHVLVDLLLPLISLSSLNSYRLSSHMSSPTTRNLRQASPSQKPASPSSHFGQNQEQQVAASPALLLSNEAVAMRLVDAAGDDDDDVDGGCLCDVGLNSDGFGGKDDGSCDNLDGSLTDDHATLFQHADTGANQGAAFTGAIISPTSSFSPPEVCGSEGNEWRY